MIFKKTVISNNTFFLFLFMVISNAQEIDKKKILEIIKAAKKHKSIPKNNKQVMISESKSIVIYKKRDIPQVYKKRNTKSNISLNVNYEKLPSLLPSSIELRRKFMREKRKDQKEILFKSPKYNNSKKINTVATKIKYF